MAATRSHVIAIALTPTAAQIAEAKRTGQGVKAVRQSTLLFSESAGLDNPAALGRDLADHLKQQGYGTKHVVLGLCSRWVLARPHQAPPADRESLRGIVNLQIERAFAGSAGDLSFDYLPASTPGADGQVPLLLTGVRRSVLEQVEQLAEAAGLKIEAITATTLAGTQAQAKGDVVLIEPGVAGVMRVGDGGAVAGLASCPADTTRLSEPGGRAKLLADLSRCVMQLPGNGGGGLTLLLPPSVAEADAQALTNAAAERFGHITTQQHDPAELLARHILAPGGERIDFTDTRLAPPKRQPMSKTTQWAIRAAVLVLLVGGTFGYLWFDASSTRDALQNQYNAIQERADRLAKVRSDTKEVEAWFDDRPRALDCMLELTQTFPTRGEIRVKTLTLEADLTGQIECTAENRQTMDRYFASMQQSSTLLDLDRGTMRPAGGKSNWIDFPIAFRYDPTSTSAEGQRGDSEAGGDSEVEEASDDAASPESETTPEAEPAIALQAEGGRP